MAKKDTSARVAALDTHVGEVLFIRSNPSVDEIKGFVEEHNRRYHEGLPGGPSGEPAYLIRTARFFDSEAEALADPDKGTEIDLSDVL